MDSKAENLLIAVLGPDYDRETPSTDEIESPESLISVIAERCVDDQVNTDHLKHILNESGCAESVIDEIL